MNTVMRTMCSFLLLSMLANGSFAQALYQEGTHYSIINPTVKTADPSRIEVSKCFWYGCRHCNSFAPIFKQWSSKLPPVVYTQHIPAVWDNTTKLHAQLFYTAAAFEKQDVMHNEIFQAFHPKKVKRYLNADQLYPLFAKHNISKKDFLSTFNSFPIRNLVTRASNTGRAYGVTGTPTLIINGKYRIKTGREMLNVANYLIKKEYALLVKMQ